ncbi:MAG: sugar phosphate isomerase/epimerase, partial [Anaerolineae bacterium]|nr:sugar phosphate isomerase/epimerase [Anaerolineae bacterium]
WDLLAVYERIQARIAHVHLSNFDGREHRLPPDGRLPLDKLLRRLAADGFQGAISVECGPDVFEASDEARCRAALRRVLDFCRQYFA